MGGIKEGNRERTRKEWGSEYRVLITEYRVRSTEYRVRSTEYRVRITEF
jgi:hypothetical protein